MEQPPNVHIAPDDLTGQLKGVEPPIKRRYAIEILEARGVAEAVIDRFRRDDTDYYRNLDEMKAVLDGLIDDPPPA